MVVRPFRLVAAGVLVTVDARWRPLAEPITGPRLARFDLGESLSPAPRRCLDDEGEQLEREAEEHEHESEDSLDDRDDCTHGVTSNLLCLLAKTTMATYGYRPITHILRVSLSRGPEGEPNRPERFCRTRRESFGGSNPPPTPAGRLGPGLGDQVVSLCRLQSGWLRMSTGT